MNKHDLRALRTDEMIREAFLSCLEETRFEQLTVTQICDRARVSRFAFYSHYEDKFHLKAVLLQTLEDRLNESICPELLEQAKKGNFMPSAERFVRDVTAHGRLISGLLKCDRDGVVKVFGRVYLDAVTALYVERYDQLIAHRPEVMLTRSYFINAMTGYAESLLSLQESIPQQDVILNYHTLIAQAGAYFIDLLRSRRTP